MRKETGVISSLEYEKKKKDNTNNKLLPWILPNMKKINAAGFFFCFKNKQEQISKKKNYKTNSTLKVRPSTLRNLQANIPE